MQLKSPLVSIVLPTHNRLAMLQHTLNTLYELDYPKDRYEIIVVNDDSTDGTATWLSSQTSVVDNVTFHSLSLPKSGPGKARNAGVNHAHGEYIFFTDDDCLIQSDCLRMLVNAMDREQCGGLAGCITCRELPGVISRFCSFIRFNVTAEDPTVLPSFINTANGFFPRRVLLEVGGFDENFPYIGSEDLDLSQRIKKLGYVLKSCPTAIVLHLNKTTAKSIHRAFFNQSRGAAYIHAKNFPQRQLPFIVEHCLKLILNIIRFVLLPFPILWNFSVKQMPLTDSVCFPLLARTTKIASMWGRIVGRIMFWHEPIARYPLRDHSQTTI